MSTFNCFHHSSQPAEFHGITTTPLLRLEIYLCESCKSELEGKRDERVGLSCRHTWNGAGWTRCPYCGDVSAEKINYTFTEVQKNRL